MPQGTRVPTASGLEEQSQRVNLFAPHSLACPFHSRLGGNSGSCLWEEDWPGFSSQVECEPAR